MYYSEIFESDKIKPESRILIFNKNTPILNPKFNIDYYTKEKDFSNIYYDFLLFEDYLTFKLYFTNEFNYSKIMIIENLITSYNQYYYHPLTYVFTNFYLSDFYNDLSGNNYGLRIIDSFRLYSDTSIPTYPIEIFLITLCKIDF